MTLRELFNLFEDPANAVFIISVFVILPIAALLLGWIAKGEGHLNPWRYIYAFIIYLVAIPGIFAITLNIYLFLFERMSVMDANLYTQVLPIISMIFTLVIVKNNVDLGWIPGFNRLSGLIMIIFSTIAIMWFLDRTRIWVISFLRFEYVIVLFLVLLVVIRFGWYRIMGKAS